MGRLFGDGPFCCIIIDMDVIELAGHILRHSIADTIYLIPFLFATYLAMEWLEHRTGSRTQEAIRRGGAAGPFVGSLLGVVPQCGFSASAATLYAGRVITLGTLFAVFLSTSDEMLPIFIAQKVPASAIFAILGIKVAVGMLAGFMIDAFARLASHDDDALRIHELCADANCGCSRDCDTCQRHPELVYEHDDDCSYGCSHEHHLHDHSADGAHGWGHIFKSAFIHTLKICVFIFVVTIVLNIFLETAGEELLVSLLGGDSFTSIALSALVGLIPNCAASLVIAQLYVQGVLGTGAMLAGLLVSAGIGVLVLFRTNRVNQWHNVAIVVGLYAIGVACGAMFASFGVTFY